MRFQDIKVEKSDNVTIIDSGGSSVILMIPGNEQFELSNSDHVSFATSDSIITALVISGEGKLKLFGTDSAMDMNPNVLYSFEESDKPVFVATGAGVMILIND